MDNYVTYKMYRDYIDSGLKRLYTHLQQLEHSVKV